MFKFYIVITFGVLCFNFVATGWTVGGILKKYTICQFSECCNENYILANFQRLKSDLNEKFYGQHIALDVVVNALRAHWVEKQPQKALTLSFHGWPGSGKNYLSMFIKDAIYKKGAKSDFVHHFIGRIHFPLEDRIEEYKENLLQWIKGNVTNCKHSLFIFDEVDKMPANILNAIKPMIDHYDVVDKVDYRYCVFIFLSNTGSTLIKDHLLNLWKKGIKRKEIGLKDFEHLIARGAFNEKGMSNILGNYINYLDWALGVSKTIQGIRNIIHYITGGFHHSDTIKSNLIDHYIPFFPMEREHVELCIQDQFKRRGIRTTDQNILNEVLSSVEWGPPPENLYSTTGCKRISQKVALVIQKYNLRSSNKHNEL